MTLLPNSMRALLTRSTILVGALTLFPACGTTSSDTDTADEGTGEEGDGDGDSSSSTGDGDGDSTTNGDGDGDSTTTTGDGDGDGDGDGGCNMDVENGGACTEDCECVTEQCYVVPVLGGLCGDCNEDSDCPDGGCNLPNPLTSEGSTCNDGSLGGGCEDDSVCQDPLTCVLILDVAGILTANTCSECASDSDCSDPTSLCTVQYDVANFTGQKVCVEPGTVPDGEGCDLEGSGTMACASGICNEVDIMGLATLGICGQCETDADCAMGETCQAAEVDITTGDVTPSMCV